MPRVKHKQQCGKREIPYSKQHQEIEIRNVLRFLHSLLSTFLEKIGPAEKSRMEPGEEPRVGQPCSSPSKKLAEFWGRGQSPVPLWNNFSDLFSENSNFSDF